MRSTPNWKRGIIGLMAVAVIPIAHSQGYLPAMERAMQQDASVDASPLMQKLDVDSNGAVDRDEAQAITGLSDVFDAVDENGNGTVSLTELSKFLALDANKV